MTINDLKEKILSLEDIMNFSIDNIFSWRGSYYEAACSISANESTKEDNLKMINKLLTETFCGWKGGEYKYDINTEIHFEESAGNYTDGQYLINFLLDNPNNKDIYTIFYENN